MDWTSDNLQQMNETLIKRTHFVGRFPLPIQLYKDSFEQWGRGDLPLADWPVVRATDLVSQASPMTPQLDAVSNRFYFKIAGWKAEGWVVSVAISMASPNPLDPLPKNPGLYLIVERIFETTPWLDPTVKAKIDISLRDGRMMQPGFAFKPPSLDTISATFTKSESVHIQEMGFRYWGYLFRTFLGRGSQVVALALDIEQTMESVPIKPMSHRILKEGDVLNIIMENLDAHTLASLHQVLQPTPPKWITNYDSFKLTLQRVIHAIVPFFPDPHAFADCMCQTGAIIGGSTALAVFNGEKWSPGDLDIVVSATFAPRLIEFITNHGYDLDNQTDDFYEGDGIQAFTWFCYRKGDLKIDISTTRKHTPAEFIGTYHHSFVMNFISHDGLYSFFPQDTSARRGRVNEAEKSHKVAAARAKYLGRGYVVIDDHPIQTITGDTGPVQIRNLKNLWSQKLPLTTYEHQRLCRERSTRDKAIQHYRNKSLDRTI